MRLDKYLKVSRIFKRRTVAKDVSSHERIMVNDKIAKPSTTIKEGDVINIQYGNRILIIKVLQIEDQIKKGDASGMYTVLEEKKIAPLPENELRKPTV
jgi:ribosomal 50S subunit-recycling heat shock protein